MVKILFLDSKACSCSSCLSYLSDNNMHYRVSSSKRKRSRSRSSSQSNQQFTECCDDKCALNLKNETHTTPPAPIRSSSLNRFQIIVAQQQKQVMFLKKIKLLFWPILLQLNTSNLYKKTSYNTLYIVVID